MVSSLPVDLYRKHKTTWYLAKFAVVVVIFGCIVAYNLAKSYYATASSTPFASSSASNMIIIRSKGVPIGHFKTSNSPDLLAVNGAAQFTLLQQSPKNSSNDTKPEVDEDDDCVFGNVPVADRCAFVYANPACKLNKYLILLYCYLSPPSLQWIFWIGAVRIYISNFYGCCCFMFANFELLCLLFVVACYFF